MSVQTFASPAPEYFEIHRLEDGYFHVKDLQPQHGDPQYLGGRFPTHHAALVAVCEVATDRRLPGFGF